MERLEVRNIVKCSAFILLMALFYCINRFLPMVKDDLLYAYIYPDEFSSDFLSILDKTKPITNIGDILLSQYNHYFTFNGRIPIHMIVQLFCGIVGKPVFDILATFVFCVFVFVLTKTYFPKKTVRFNLVCVSLFLLFLLTSEPTCFYYGISYSCNYLWASTFCLLLLYFFRTWNLNAQKTFFISILAFVAGWSHEGLVIGMSAGFVCYVLKNRFTLSVYQWIIIITFFVGASLLIFSPANFIRAEHLNSSSIPNTHMRLFDYIRATYALCAVSLVILLKDRKKFMLLVRENACYFTAFIFSFLFILLVGALNKRSVYGVDFFAIILLVRLLDGVSFFERHRYITLASTIVLISAMFCVAYYQYNTGKQYKTIYCQLEETTAKECWVLMDRAYPPSFLRRYICKYDEAVANRYEYKNLLWKYDKTKLIIDEGFKYKVPGDNPFFRFGNSIYTTEILPQQIEMKWKLCKQNYAVVMMKKLASHFINVTNDEMVLQLNVDTCSLDGIMYSYVKLSPNMDREVESMSLLHK